jgi:sulfate transport system permease protein
VLRVVVLGYLTALLLVPLGFIVRRTFAHGLGPVWAALTTPSAVHALLLTTKIALLTVLLNALFGVGAALLIARHRFPGRALFNAALDLPLAVSPVVVGLAIVLVYGQSSAAGGWLHAHGVDVVFSTPGMVLATVFVSLPLVVREVVPVLEEIGVEQEQAAWTLGASGWQTFWRVTLPAIRWAVGYGVVLTLARALGEYGAVAVVSGRVVDHTQTATLYVEQQFQAFEQQSAYAMAFALAAFAVVALVAATFLRPKEPGR